MFAEGQVLIVNTENRRTPYLLNAAAQIVTGTPQSYYTFALGFAVAFTGLAAVTHSWAVFLLGLVFLVAPFIPVALVFCAVFVSCFYNMTYHALCIILLAFKIAFDKLVNLAKTIFPA